MIKRSKKNKIPTFKEALSKVLTPKQMQEVKTSHDILGNIAIIEIPDSLKRKEKVIAKMLLKINPKIKTVLKKAEQHSGVFRTQKMKWLAGEKTKVADYKENNVVLRFNVENVYFSSRLSTERKRIYEQVKKGEDVLVMFSGAAPYVCVIAKNTNAKTVTGVEINPEAHKYGMKNLELNKIHNAVLVNADVHDFSKEVYKYIIGLKSANKHNELESRYVHHPHIMEFHTFPNDLTKNIKKLEKEIQKLINKNVHVIIHMPFFVNNHRPTLSRENPIDELKEFYILGKLCKKYHCKAIIHPTFEIGTADKEEWIINNLKKLKQYFDYFYFENITDGIYTKTENILRINKSAGIKNVCIDTCHLFITYSQLLQQPVNATEQEWNEFHKKVNDKIINHIKVMQDNFNTYFHLNDHDYKVHSLEIGKGFVDFDRILPYVHMGVTEVNSKNNKTARAMIRSYEKIDHKHRKYDRIIMPLPKTADEFLQDAFKLAKKGTVIHFYDFLHESEFNNAKEKVLSAADKHNKKVKILNFTKCGQYSPRKYRVCVDFEVIS